MIKGLGWNKGRGVVARITTVEGFCIMGWRFGIGRGLGPRDNTSKLAIVARDAGADDLAVIQRQDGGFEGHADRVAAFAGICCGNMCRWQLLALNRRAVGIGEPGRVGVALDAACVDIGMIHLGASPGFVTCRARVAICAGVRRRDMRAWSVDLAQRRTSSGDVSAIMAGDAVGNIQRQSVIPLGRFPSRNDMAGGAIVAGGWQML